MALIMQSQTQQAKHSVKTLETITIMGTMPEDWGIVPFTVRSEVRNMILPTECSNCNGKGFVYNPLTNMASGQQLSSNSVFESLKEQILAHESVESDWQARDLFFKGTYARDEDGELARDEDGRIIGYENPLMTEFGWMQTTTRGSVRLPCSVCPTKQGRSRYGGARGGTGIIHLPFENVPVNAHYPSWPEGTQFTSRFPRGHGGCEACGKTHIKTGEFPVAAQKQDGTWVGMFVGNSCLKKFGFSAFKSVDQQATKWNLKKSISNPNMWVSKAGQGEGRSPVPMRQRVIDIYLRSRVNLGADLEVVSAPSEVVEEVIETEVKTVKPIEVKDISLKGEKGAGKTLSLKPSKTFDCPHCSKVFKSRQGRYNHLKKTSCGSQQS